jgi:phage host-nuclease inhibitor protein Gam
MATEAAQAGEARAAVSDRLRRLARTRASLDALSAELEAGLLTVRRRRQGAIARLRRRLDAMLSELEAYCRAERDAVLPEGRKSLLTPFGEVSFRRAEPSLLIEDGAEEEVCAALKERDLGDLVRVRESVDRRALRRALEEGRLSEQELRRMGLKLVERDEAFGCKIRHDALVAVGGQGA